MKKVSFLFLLVSQLNAYSQAPAGEGDYREGIRYLNGVVHRYDPQKAREFFWKAANLQHSKAMVALGNIYSKGLAGTPNGDSAFYWFSAASKAGATHIAHLVGRMYQFGKGVKKDFATAARYYQEGINQNNNPCKTAFAYLSYKGLGTIQSYETAFRLFKEVAETDSTQQAMYFLGLCYRNGYGTIANADLAKLWLQQSADFGDVVAYQELYEESTPENLSVISPALQNELQSISNHAEQFQAHTTNNYEGSYSGYAIYYDWSGRYVSEILPLQVDLQKTANGYSGTWQEGDNNSSAISMTAQHNRFTFGKHSWYTRNNHYSGRKHEVWNFNDADLNLSFLGNSIQLSGFVRFYSTKRGEPGKPLQIILKKQMVYSPESITSVYDLKLFPNPASTQCMVQFRLAESAKVNVQVFTVTGNLVHFEQEKLLPAGIYNYPVSLTKLAAGAYYVKVMVNGRQAETKTLIKQ